MKLIIKHKHLIALFGAVTSAIASIYILFNCNNRDYKYLWILPLAFMILSPFLLKGLVKLSFSPFVVILYTLSFIRFVLTPYLMVLKDFYSYRSPVDPTSSAILKAELLMIYELISISIFFNIRKPDFKNTEFGDRESNIRSMYSHPKSGLDIYYLYILICLVIVIISPQVRQNINILFPRINYSSEISSFIHLLVLMVILAKNLIFIMLIQKLYEKQVNGFLLYFSLFLLILINSSVYFGLNRSDFILNFIASIYISAVPFKKQTKRLCLFLVPISLIILNIITNARNYYIFFTDPILSFLFTTQGYTGSLYNVAISVEAADYFPEGRNLLVLINDFLRPSLGFNVIMKPLNIPLSNYFFNARMYLRNDHIVQIMPMIGQGYFLLGPFLAPLLGIIFCEIAIRLMKLLSRSDIISMFFLTITCTRLGFFVAQNSQIQMNDLSFNLFLFFIVYWANKHFHLRKIT